MEPLRLPCGLCERSFQEKELSRHHCLPRSRGGTVADIALICKQCHGMVHATFHNATLEALYPTIAKLREAPELEPYLRWVRKQPATRRTRNASRRQKI